MTTKNQLLKFSFFIVWLFILSCKKYPEDEHISLRRPEHRILGSWQITKYEVDGIDSTAYFASEYGYSYLVFKNEKGGRFRTYTYTKQCDNCEEHYFSGWSISKPKKKSVTTSIGQIRGIDWTILKLSDSEMKLSGRDYHKHNMAVSLVK